MSTTPDEEVFDGEPDYDQSQAVDGQQDTPDEEDLDA